MRSLILLAAILCAVWAAILGFGWVDDADLLEDFSGWLAAALALGLLSGSDWVDR
jgi:hypothetical protein